MPNRGLDYQNLWEYSTWRQFPSKADTRAPSHRTDPNKPRGKLGEKITRPGRVDLGDVYEPYRLRILGPALDMPALIAGIAAGLKAEIVAIVQQEIKAAIIQTAATYYPRPIPQYAPHELRELGDIQPHPSRPREITEFLGGDPFQFQCRQQALFFEKLIARKSNLLVMLRCGMGKTFLALLAAQMYGKHRTTIYILPHSGLHLDFVRRATEMGLTLSKWEPKGQFNRNAQVIWCAVEHMDFEDFKAELVGMGGVDRLDRIVFDEAHKVTTDAHYREIFSKFCTLTEYGAQVVAMCATYPPHLFPEFQTRTGILKWDIIRTRISRPNICIKVQVEANDAALLKALVNFVNDRCSSYHPEDRLMIFTRSVADAEKLAAEFNTKPYHAKQKPEINQKLYNDWILGKLIVQVSTSLLGTGLSCSGVRDVVMFHFPFSFFDLQQQMDRGGRDGQTAFATTFITKDEKVLFKNQENRIPLGQQEMEEWGHRGDRCRRIGPSLYFDGVAQVCSMVIEPNVETSLCDFCDAESRRPAPLTPVSMPESSIPEARATVPVARPTRKDPQPTNSRPKSTPVQQPASGSRHSSTAPSDFAIPAPISRGVKVAPPSGLGATSTPLSSQSFPSSSRVVETPSFPSSPDPPNLPPSLRLPSAPAKPRAPAKTKAASGPPSAPLRAPVGGRTPEEVNAQTKATAARRNSIRGKCPACWARGYEWGHDYDTCVADVAKDGDDDWNAWHRGAFDFPEGWCWFCFMPQQGPNRPQGGWHYYVQGPQRNCRDSNLFKPALYAFLTATKLDHLHISQCRHVDAQLLEGDDLIDFRLWCNQVYEPGGPLLNVHLFLLWLIFKRQLVECPPELVHEFL
ncbi:P-loop containing nucleoside triphosphate hydrolase protein [Mycena capillaripes]|nr:P-loop containing nucleoside triphosphate hydrolase protein [Mycena capillaripes]